MANKFLDKTGLSYLWYQIKGLLSSKADLDENGKILTEQLPDDIGGSGGTTVTYATEEQIIEIFNS